MAYLEVERDGAAERVALTGETFTIGRESSNSLQFSQDRAVSNQHAVLERLPAGWSIEDSGSSNGTYVNGHRLTSARLLRAGDRIAVGKSQIAFLSDTADGLPGPASGYLDSTEEWTAGPATQVPRSGGEATFDPGPATPREPIPTDTDNAQLGMSSTGLPEPSGVHQPLSDPPERRSISTVLGEARGIQQRTESYGENVARTIWTFRVERYDTAGNRLPPIPVQMRGLEFDGSLSEGDEVRVGGRWKDGTLHSERVDNLTTRASVKTRSLTKVMVLSIVVFLTIAMLMIAGFIACDSIAKNQWCQEVTEQIEQTPSFC
ncbi:FHA domain-containing protein [Nocardia sp. 2YAB30]|uniref:FHA domain-containing protein n=1 Tax=unclassified Nocardia TaxID=2637762 RepID=UPI003F97F833